MATEIAWDVGITWSDLPARQQAVLLGVARGLSNKEIADELGIALSTVRNNVADLYDRLDLSNRVQALLWVLNYEDLAAEVVANS